MAVRAFPQFSPMIRQRLIYEDGPCTSDECRGHPFFVIASTDPTGLPDSVAPRR